MPHWQGIATFSWDFHADCKDTEAHNIARKLFTEAVVNALPPEMREKFTLRVKANKRATRIARRKRLGGPFKPEEVFPYLWIYGDDPATEYRKYPGEDKEYRVAMDSVRYKIFKRDDCTCQACGLKAEFFYLETDRSFTTSDRAHLNLYAIEAGQEVLFTKDHIHPRHKGGSESVENLQTYCSICNGIKGNAITTNETVKLLRLEYNKLRAEGSKQLTLAIRQLNVQIGSHMGDGFLKSKRSKLAAKVQHSEAKNKSTHPLQRAVVPLTLWQRPGAGYWVIPSGEPAPKADAIRVKDYPAGSIFATHRGAGGHFVSVFLEEGVRKKYMVNHKYLEPLNERPLAGGGSGESDGPDLVPEAVPVSPGPDRVGGDGDRGEAGGG